MGSERARARPGADDRFVVRGKLGAGGMGVVYRALDRARDREVALKTLRVQSARDLYRFKREFRTLCDLHHPNLCALYELHTTGDEWFFTMELVRGVGFIDWVRPSGGSDRPPPDRDDGDDGDDGAGRDDRDDAAAAVTGEQTGPPLAPRSRTEILAAKVELERLERGLGQLCDGIHALHVAGKLHRDLKPSNVLVDPTGRVVLLDFGLVADVESMAADATHERAAVGTPVYMSPEQAADTPLTPASDWYAVGVILYEALTGRRPFEGRPEEVMRRKQHEVPPRPAQLAPGTPAHLDDLCMAMLAPDPRARPDGRAVLEALGREPSLATATVERTATGPFVGREPQLAQLEAALAASRRAGVTVLVHGASGMGKSALLARFAADVGGEAPAALVLAGRCYERESVPFKTLDTLIDALTTALLKLEPAALAAVLPRDVAAIARLFPVLRRVPLIAEPEVRRFQPADPQELRRRAWGALRWLLARLAEDRPVVLCIDDLQWGDLDSAGFLGDLLARADRPPVLVVLAYRSEDVGSPPIAEVTRRAASAAPAADVRTIEVPPLALDEARELVRRVSGSDGDVEDWAASLVRDAGGNTLFLAELARSAVTAGGAPTLDELVRGRAARLGADARALLTACAVAARPLAIEIAARAAGLADPAAAVAALRAERLVRFAYGEQRVEPFHDRVRAAVVDGLSAAELTAAHRALAGAYAAATPVAHEALVEHLLGADDPAAAAAHALAAAQVAEDALAFRRAAELYGLALQYGELAPAERRAHLRARGRALVNAGHLAEAAATYDEALVDAPADERVELERLRLEQVLRAGRLAEGMVAAERLLAGIGYQLPRTRRAAIAKLVAQRVALRLRGLGFRERAEDALPAAEVREVDLLWSIASGLAFANPMTGKLVQLWHLRRALALGEPRRVATALAVEVGYIASAGVGNAARAARMMARAREVAEKHGDPFRIGMVEASIGLGHLLLGRFRLAHDHLEAGLRLMRDHGVDARWEIDIAEHYYLASLFYLGELRELARWTPVLLREAEERGDVYAQHGLRAWRSNLAWLILGKPADARAHLLGVANERGDTGDVQLHDYYHLGSSAALDLYLGDGEGALARVERAWPALEGSLLLRVQSVAVESWFLRDRDRGGAGGVEPGPGRARGRRRRARRRRARGRGPRLRPRRGAPARRRSGLPRPGGAVGPRRARRRRHRPRPARRGRGVAARAGGRRSRGAGARGGAVLSEGRLHPNPIPSPRRRRQHADAARPQPPGGDPAGHPHRVAGPRDPRPGQRPVEGEGEAVADQPQLAAAALHRPQPRPALAGDVVDVEPEVDAARAVAAEAADHRAGTGLVARHQAGGGRRRRRDRGRRDGRAGGRRRRRRGGRGLAGGGRGGHGGDPGRQERGGRAGAPPAAHASSPLAPTSAASAPVNVAR